MPRLNVLKFAGLKGIGIPNSSTLFEVLLKSVMGILNLTEERAMDVIKVRISVDSNSQAFSGVLLSCDDAVELIDHNDKEAVGLEMKNAAQQAESNEAFVEEFRLMRIAQKDAGPKSKKKKGSGLVHLPHEISQVEAKQFLPPDCTIWCGNTRPEWWGHCPPYKRIVESWALNDSDNSEHLCCKRVIARLWRQYGRKEGVPIEECPFDLTGMFGD